nr:formyl transferase [Colletotrichum truncatum]KAF6794879.1 formyl transferase [Colletotrichum truncatum]
MLVDGLRRGLHVPPLEDVGWKPQGEEEDNLCHAPKVTKHDRQVNWSKWSADDIVLRQRVLGPMWCEAMHHGDQKVLRLIFEDVQVVERPDRVKEWLKRFQQRKNGSLAAENVPEADLEVKSVTWLWKPEGPGGKDPESWGRIKLPYFEEEDGQGILIPAMKGGCLRVPIIKVEGSKGKPAAKAIVGFGKIEEIEDAHSENGYGISDAIMLGVAGWLDL